MVSCNMGANNTITTASSSSLGAPWRPTSFLNSKYLLTSSVVVSHKRVENIPILYEYVLDITVQMGCLGALTNQASPSCPSQSALKRLDL